jgi:hypothetical protein
MMSAKLMVDWTEEVHWLGGSKTHFDNSTTLLLEFRRATQTSSF